VSAGRWTGRIGEWTRGDVILNVDEISDSGCEGYAYFYHSEIPIAASIFIDVSHPWNGLKTKRQIVYFDPTSALIIDRSQQYLEKMYPDYAFPDWIDFGCQYMDERTLKCSVAGINGSDTEINFSLLREQVPEFSALNAEPIGWSDFKTKINSNQSGTHFFCGQNAPWSLQSTFHRSDRNCLHRFNDKDVPQLHILIRPN